MSTPPATTGPPGIGGKVGETTPKNSPKVMEKRRMNDDRQNQRAAENCSSCATVSPLIPGTTIPASRLIGNQRAMATEQTVGQGRDGHHQPPDDSTFHAGGDRVDLLGKLEPITHHSRSELVDRAGPFDDRPRTEGWLDYRQVPMPVTRQQLPNPTAKADDEEQCADDGQREARNQAST